MLFWSGLCAGLAVALIAVAGFINFDLYQWRLGPITYRRAGKVGLVMIGRFHFARIGWRWRICRDDQPEAAQ